MNEIQEIVSGLLYVNGEDLFLSCGAFLSEERQGDTKNYDALMMLAKAKPRTAVDFPERAGKDYGDDVTTVLDERQVTLRFSIEAADVADFMAKRRQLMQLFCSGMLSFRFPELGATYHFLYEENTQWSQLTDFSGKVYASCLIRFTEPNPTC
jgi:hypothetical protein